MPSTSVTMQASPAVNTATITNTLARSLVPINLEKTVTGGPNAGVTGAFQFEANCGADGTFTGSVMLNAASSGTGSITGIPAGATCTVAEAANLPAPPTGLTWGPLPADQTTTNVQSGANSLSFVNTLEGVAPGLTATPVPTLNQWALALLSLVLGGFAVTGIRRSRMR